MILLLFSSNWKRGLNFPPWKTEPQAKGCFEDQRPWVIYIWPTMWPQGHKLQRKKNVRTQPNHKSLLEVILAPSQILMFKVNISFKILTWILKKDRQTCIKEFKKYRSSEWWGFYKRSLKLSSRRNFHKKKRRQDHFLGWLFFLKSTMAAIFRLRDALDTSYMIFLILEQVPVYKWDRELESVKGHKV